MQNMTLAFHACHCLTFRLIRARMSLHEAREKIVGLLMIMWPRARPHGNYRGLRLLICNIPHHGNSHIIEPNITNNFQHFLLPQEQPPSGMLVFVYLYLFWPACWHMQTWVLAQTSEILVASSLLPSRRSEVGENPSTMRREMRNDRCIPYIDSTCAIRPLTCDKFSNF